MTAQLKQGLSFQLSSKRTLNLTSSELRDFWLADQAADEARDMIDELMKMHGVLAAQIPSLPVWLPACVSIYRVPCRASFGMN